MYQYAYRRKNRHKRDYAVAYVKYLLGQDSKPALTESIPYMAIQAVRMSLDELNRQRLAKEGA